MMQLIDPNTTLIGRRAQLLPLEEKYFEELTALALSPGIFDHMSVNMRSKNDVRFAFGQALQEKALGKQFPFVIFDKGIMAGSTRFMNIELDHRKLEIGATWMHPSFWATGLNTECKLLLLTFCFEQFKTIRVEFKTDEKNLRSRRAIEKLGAKFEGIHRNHIIRHNGTFRNSVFYSIIDSEWESVKKNLTGIVSSWSDTR